MSQYVYFTVISETLTAEAITAELGITPDRTSVRGSKATSPQARPSHHRWSIYCGNTAQRIDAQAAAVLERIAPAATAVRRLVDAGDVKAELVFVRHFNDEDGQEETTEPITTSDGLVLDPIAGQHQLLGWVLKPDQLVLLAAMRASIDADEYG